MSASDVYKLNLNLHEVKSLQLVLREHLAPLITISNSLETALTGTLVPDPKPIPAAEEITSDLHDHTGPPTHAPAVAVVPLESTEAS